MADRERLDKVLSNMGYGSRKQVKQYIKDGLVTVNGELPQGNNVKVQPYEDEIIIDGQKVDYREYIYLMLNKPKGYISSTDEYLGFTVLELIDYEYLVFEPFPAGRLDKDTEGLLFLTNDGKLAHRILAPKNKVPKTYYVEVDGRVEESHIEKFKEGVSLEDGYKTLPAELEILESNIISKVELTIVEGKFHQVKRMFESLGMTVVYLKRLSMGPLKLDKNLELGEYRELTEEELEALEEI